MLLSTQEYLARMSSSRRGATSYDTGYGRNVEALRGSPVATSPSMLAAAEPPVPVESPCDEELQLLRERVEKLENAVKRTQELYNKTVNDIFNSVPAKASSMERGAVQYPFRQPSRVEICFGRRFPETPKIAVWISLRDPVVQHAGSAAAAAAASAATSNSGSGAGYLIENELGAELIKIKPACITVNNRLAIVKLPQEVINAAATFERKQKAVLHWIAWCTNTVNPRLAALIQKVISSPAAGLSRQVNNKKINKNKAKQTEKQIFIFMFARSSCLLLF